MKNKNLTTEDIIADALKYNTRTEWQQNSLIYHTAKRRKILNICCMHMQVLRKSWTNDEILYDAYQYSVLKEWANASPKIYREAVKRKLIPTCTSHMKRYKKIWTEEDLIKDAEQYNFRSEWETRNVSAYRSALKRGIMEKCCKHMQYKPSCFTHNLGVIYIFEFSDKSVYIGLTVDPKRRLFTHLKMGVVCEKIKEVEYYNYRLLEENISNEKLSEREIFHINNFKARGFRLLNKSKGGSRGSVFSKWTNEKIKASAQKYTSVSEWIADEPAAYQASQRRKIFQECRTHMIPKTRQWTNQQIIDASLMYITKKDWYKSKSYRMASKRKIIEMCNQHMI